jgi:plastocyanin
MTRIVVLIAVALLAAACGPDAEAPDGDGATARFVAVDIDFEEAPSEIAAGDVTVELVNEGNLEHNVVFEGVDGDEPVVEAMGGETATGSVSLEQGEYVAYCSVPGHREAGMEATVTVEG